jgi:Cu2+-exporting ATPase
MSCCGGAVLAANPADAPASERTLRRSELQHAGQRGDGTTAYCLSLPELADGKAMRHAETTAQTVTGVTRARANLTLRRLAIELSDEGDILAVVEQLEAAGFRPTPIDLGDFGDMTRDRSTNGLLVAMAVAGFAAANIMLLSVSIWSGAESDTRNLFHLISALIAIPTVFFSGRVFFRSALTALGRRRLNMDVPISLAILLALAMSLHETLTGGSEAYFDAAVTLLFFLLVGRTLDQHMREKASGAIESMARLSAKCAMVVTADGTVTPCPVDEVQPGQLLRVVAGNRFPVDGEIVSGATSVDRSIVTGESAPVALMAGDRVEAGALNMDAPVDIRATTTAETSFTGEIKRMLEAAQRGRGTYVRIADRMAAIYAPAVHLLALVAFVAWMMLSGGDWHRSLYVAISVLIITCPCALGLAVPVVQVVAASRLLREGILMRDGAALERLAEVDTVVFDKTGTLTTGKPAVTALIGNLEGSARKAAAALASQSSHPLAFAVDRYLGAKAGVALENVTEQAGLGVEALWSGKRIRLGQPGWVGEITSTQADEVADSGLCFAVEGDDICRFETTETLRSGAKSAVKALKTRGLGVEILSGDSASAVERVGQMLEIDAWQARTMPVGKTRRIAALRDCGHHTLMVGDGINDAPSLASAHVSMAPSTAADVGRSAADLLFTRDSLLTVPMAHQTALRARAIIRQNFAIAIAYNFVSVPLAMAGLVTPLIAAIAMSASSVVVIANSLRLMTTASPVDRDHARPLGTPIAESPGSGRTVEPALA